MHLLEHPPAQLLEGWWPTPVSVGMRCPLESPWQQLPVWLMETGDDQLVNVCIYQIPLLLHLTYNVTWLIDTGASCGDPPSGTNASPGTPSSTTYLGTVLYTCDSGYEVSTGVTMATATCMANGNWGSLPTCQRMYQIPLLLHTPNLQRYMINGYRCLMWWPSLWYQCISWITLQHNLPRNSPLHLCHWIPDLHWSHHSNSYL